MARNYEQLVKQIDLLKRQADQVRKKEIAGVVSRMKVAIEFYGLSPEDLFGGKTKAAASPAAPKAKPAAAAAHDGAARFGDGAGNTWVGRGPRPQWLKDAIAGGKSLKDFALGGSAEKKPAEAGSAKTPAKKYLSAVKYRDDAGHEWSGRGPKPVWVKDALTAGKTLQDLSV